MFLVQLAEAVAANARKAIDRSLIFAAKQRLLELEAGKQSNWKNL